MESGRAAQKSLPFSPVFSMLGIQVDLTASGNGVVTVRNKPERNAEISKELLRILEKGSVPRGEASSLHGRLNFAQGQLHGCPLKPALSFLSQVSTLGWHDARKHQLAVSLAYAEVPRSVDACDARPPARLFTDGSWESGTGGAGAVLYLSPDDQGKVAAVQVPDALVEPWSKEGDAQLIAKFELVPILAALLAWGSEIAGRRLLIFVDNNGVRDSLIKGSTPVPNLFSMLALIAGLLSSLDITPWYTRVASKSSFGSVQTAWTCLRFCPVGVV